MFWVGVLVGGGVMLLFVADSHYERTKNRAFRNQSRKQIACQALDNTDLCQRLARLLEIEADGGDNPAEFVRDCIRQAWTEADSEHKTW